MSKHWYNNGKVQHFCEECPGEDFVLGMLQSSKDKMSKHIKSDEHKKKLSVAHTGKTSSNKGVPHSESTKRKISDSLRGNTPWNKGLTAENDERIKNQCNAATKTKVEKYGSASPNFGKHLSKEHRAKIGKSNSGDRGPMDESRRISFVSKSFETKRKNNTFNTSKPETQYYNHLCEQFGKENIKRNFKSEKYPFHCDFYIVPEDAYVELNLHWTHGGKPFDPNDKTCQEQLSFWQEKAKTSQFYKNAIETWTVRDVNKAKCAKENNLNYTVIY